MKISYLFSSLLVFVSTLEAATLNIPGSSVVETLPSKLLHEVVARSSKYQSINYVYGEQGDASFARTQEDVNAGELDIMWTASSEEYEDKFTAIYFPIYKGTLGIRLAIIEKEKSQLFRDITTLQQLQTLVACQGKLWADTPILEANGVGVAGSIKYVNLFPMLEGDRCDYFPRAMFEPWSEVKRESKFNLMVDEHIVIRYIMPNFFFVKKDNNELAEHIEEILYRMHEDGSFDLLFMADRDVRDALDYSNINNRRVFHFKNPFLTQQVQDIPEAFWFKITNS